LERRFAVPHQGGRLQDALPTPVRNGLAIVPVNAVGAKPVVVAEMNSVAGMLSLARRTRIGAVVSQLAVGESKEPSRYPARQS
jgi:hypothetical protein